MLQDDPRRKPNTASTEIHAGYKTYDMGTTEEDSPGGSHIVMQQGLPHTPENLS